MLVYMVTNGQQSLLDVCAKHASEQKVFSDIMPSTTENSFILVTAVLAVDEPFSVMDIVDAEDGRWSWLEKFQFGVVGARRRLKVLASLKKINDRAVERKKGRSFLS